MRAKGRYFIRDIFGLTRTSFGKEDARELAVLPASIPSLRMKDIVTSQGFEDSIKKRSQDEERYFMREYIPGDRLRDIDRSAGEIFVFTTQYDGSLAAFLAEFPRAKATVVQTFTASRKEKARHALFRLFVPFRAALIPGAFIFRKEKRPKTTAHGHSKNMIWERDLLEIRFF
jgi:hypothetical protein